MSRRSKHRAGTRLNTRGVDRAGNPANFVETEQLIWTHEEQRLLAFVQVRGSVPVFWAQPPNLSYHPCQDPQNTMRSERKRGERRERERDSEKQVLHFVSIGEQSC